MLIVYTTTPVPEIIYKYPTPDNSVVYQDDVQNCYRYVSKEVPCKGEITEIPIQQVDLEEKSKESIITQFNKMIKQNV
jgi:hypothetical protein